MAKEKSEENRAFWEEFCVKSQPRLLSYARALTNGDVSSANDLVQTTILRVLKYCPDPEPVGNHLAYLVNVLRNSFFDSLRVPKNTSLEDLLDTDPNHPAIVRPADIVEILEGRELFEKVLGPMSHELRITLVMRLEGYSWQEIADYLGEDVSKTKFRWYTFLKRLHKRVKRLKENGRD